MDIKFSVSGSIEFEPDIRRNLGLDGFAKRLVQIEIADNLAQTLVFNIKSVSPKRNRGRDRKSVV